MSKKSRSNPPWSEIPPEILLKIGELTAYPIHRSRIPAVCKPWRSAFAADVENRGIKTFPLKIPYPTIPLKSPPPPSLFVVPTTSYVIQPTSGSLSFLVTVDEINPGYISPRAPLSASHCNVRGIRNRSPLDLLENRVIVLNPGFSLRILDARRNVSEKDGRVNELSYKLREFYEKAIVCKNPCCDDDLLVMVLQYRQKLMSLRIRDGEWKTVVDGEVSRCVDVVKFKDEIYGIDHLGGAFFVDYDYGSGDANVVSVAAAVEDGGEKARRLVVDSSSNERLYMVELRTDDNKEDIWFVVYRLKELKEDLGVWVKVKSIGNRMFFFGVNFSFCATSRDFPGLAMSCIRSIPRNCIFFRKGSFKSRTRGVARDDLLFQIDKEGIGMHIGHYYLNATSATGLLEPAFVIMFSNALYGVIRFEAVVKKSLLPSKFHISDCSYLSCGNTVSLISGAVIKINNV